MDYHEILKAVAFCVIIFMFVMFFGLFTQIFSGNLEQFFIWKTVYNSQSFAGSLINSAPKNVIDFPVRDWQVENLKIDADASFSAQLDGRGREKILFENNGDKQLLIASLTKLMTAAVALDNHDLLEKVVVSKEDVAQGGNLRAGDSLSVKDLLYAMLIGSDNSAAYALSKIMGREKFVALMNEKAKEFGMENTYYTNSVGFGTKTHSTAGDLAKLTYQILENYPQIFAITAMPEYDVLNFDGSLNYKAKNTNEFLNDDSLDWEKRIVGSKTGANEIAGGCFVLVLKSPDDDGYLINVILNSEDRFLEMKKIINWVNTAYKWK